MYSEISDGFFLHSLHFIVIYLAFEVRIVIKLFRQQFELRGQLPKTFPINRRLIAISADQQRDGNRRRKYRNRYSPQLVVNPGTRLPYQKSDGRSNYRPIEKIGQT
jgi:regulatory protein YycH of two-component signal transduction system YycFG